MDDLMAEFLAETSEGLAAVDDALLRLERQPEDRAPLAEIFRIVHTIKGTCELPWPAAAGETGPCGGECAWAAIATARCPSPRKGCRSCSRRWMASRPSWRRWRQREPETGRRGRRADRPAGCRLCRAAACRPCLLRLPCCRRGLFIGVLRRSGGGSGPGRARRGGGPAGAPGQRSGRDGESSGSGGSARCPARRRAGTADDPRLGGGAGGSDAAGQRAGADAQPAAATGAQPRRIRPSRYRCSGCPTSPRICRKG